MAVLGYARVSTTDQNLEAQVKQLESSGVEKIFMEKASGAKQDRPQLSALLDYCREGDIFIVTKLDRLGRSLPHLLQTVQTLKEKGVTFKCLNLSMDTSTPTGELMFNVIAAVAQFERQMLLERQKEGIAIAKQKGVYKGRKPTAREKAEQVIKLIESGKTREAVAKELEIGIRSVFRILKDNRDTTASSNKVRMSNNNCSLQRTSD